MKELERENPRFHLDEGNRKVQRFDDHCLEGRRVELAASVRAQRPVSDLGQRAGRQPRQLLRRPRLDPSPACTGRRPGARPSTSAAWKETPSACRRPRVVTKRMWRGRGRPVRQSPTRRSAASPPISARTAIVMASAARRAASALAHSAKIDGTGSRQTASERAGIERRTLDHGETRHQRRPARLGDVSSRIGRSARSPRGAGRRPARRDSPTGARRRRAGRYRRAAPAPSPFRSRDRDARPRR